MLEEKMLEIIKNQYYIYEDLRRKHIGNEEKFVEYMYKAEATYNLLQAMKTLLVKELPNNCNKDCINCISLYLCASSRYTDTDCNSIRKGKRP